MSVALKEDLIQEQILQAAKRLFAAYGLAKVTMDDVARAIGKGRSSLYYYYKSKDELFDTVVNIEIRDMIAAMEQAVVQAATVEAKLYAFFVTKLRMRERGSFFDAIKVGMDADTLTDFNKTKLAHHTVIMQMEGALLLRILNEGIKQGEVKAMEKSEMDHTVFVLLCGLRGLRNELNLANNTMPVDAAIAQFTGLMMNGLKK